MKELQSLKQWVKDYDKAKLLSDDLEILFEYFKESEIEENEINIGVMMQCFRIALVGKLSGPDLFEICKFLDKDIILVRISKAIYYFKQKT